MTWEDKRAKANCKMKARTCASGGEIINCTEEVKCHEEFGKTGKIYR